MDGWSTAIKYLGSTTRMGPGGRLELVGVVRRVDFFVRVQHPANGGVAQGKIKVGSACSAIPLFRRFKYSPATTGASESTAVSA